jgi:hypothetical protein
VHKVMTQKQEQRHSDRSIHVWIVTVAILTMGLACQLPALSTTPVYVIANLVTTSAFVIVGMLIRRQPGRRGLGTGLAAGGAFWSFQWVATWNSGPFVVISTFAIKLQHLRRPAA